MSTDDKARIKAAHSAESFIITNNLSPKCVMPNYRFDGPPSPLARIRVIVI